jgi:outer membrane immunogenic protein
MTRFQLALLGIAAGAAFGLSATVANADGLAYRGHYRASVPDVSWTGCYVGVQAGYMWSNVDGLGTNIAGLFPTPYEYDVDGFVGGGHIGCNYQRGSIVVGVEGDLEGSAADGSATAVSGALTYEHETEVNWMASLRGRLGYASGSSLFYLTAGWAWAEVDHSIGFAGVAEPFHTYSETRDGWTVGAGYEVVMTRRITARIEYRYTDLGSVSDTNAGANSIDRNDMDFHAVRLGLTAKF